MKYLLILLISFVAITSVIISCLLLMVPDGSILNLPLNLLKNTRLKNFQFPGLLLLIVIGFTFLLTLYINIKRSYKSFNYSIISGTTLSLWMLFQMLIVPQLFLINIFYLFIGISIILLSLQLKGKILL